MNTKTLYAIIAVLSLLLIASLSFIAGTHSASMGTHQKNPLMRTPENTPPEKTCRMDPATPGCEIYNGILSDSDQDTAMKEHCQMMPEMKGCEKYMTDTGTMDHSMMDMSQHDPMQMSMADMGKMLEGKSGDDLDRAFLEGMIPHHQGAIDMARYLEKSQRPELQELGRNIIKAQQAEIEQMQKWLVEWDLAGTGTTN